MLEPRLIQSEPVELCFEPGSTANEGHAATKWTGDPNMDISDNAAQQSRQPVSECRHQPITSTQLFTYAVPDLDQAGQNVFIDMEPNSINSHHGDFCFTGLTLDFSNYDPNFEAMQSPVNIHNNTRDGVTVPELISPVSAQNQTSPVPAEKWTSPMSSEDSGYASYGIFHPDYSHSSQPPDTSYLPTCYSKMVFPEPSAPLVETAATVFESTDDAIKPICPDRAANENSHTQADERGAVCSMADTTKIPPDATSQRILTICKAIAYKLRPLCDVNKRWRRLSRKIPDLIKDFALDFFLEEDEFSDRRVASFLVTNHQEIATHLQSILRFEKSTHARLETSRPSIEKMSLSDKMSLWSRVSSNQDERLDYPELCEGVREAPENEDDDSDTCSSHETTEFGNAVPESEAYWRLITDMSKELDPNFPVGSRLSFNTFYPIRREIVGELLTSRSTSPISEPMTAPKKYKAAFHLPWGPMGSTVCPVLSGRELADCVVLTWSSEEHIQASTLEEYLHRAWLPGRSRPESRLIHVLGIALEGNSFDTQAKTTAGTTLPDKSNQQIWTTAAKDAEIVVWVAGSPHFIAECGATLAWIVAALQPLTRALDSDHGFYSTPILKPVADTAGQPSSEKQTADAVSCRSWIIEGRPRSLSAESFLRKQALYSQVFGAPPALVKGFPTTPRPGSFSGTEVTAETLFRWVPNPRLKTADGRVTLEGEQTTLGLHKRASNVLLWHIIRSVSLAGCTCDIGDDTEHDLDVKGVDELLYYRHILADCDGTRAATKIEHSSVPLSPDHLNQGGVKRGRQEVPSQDLPESRTDSQSLLTPNAGPTIRGSPSSATWSPGISLDSDVLSISDTSEDVITDPDLCSEDPSFRIIDATARLLLAKYRSQNSTVREHASGTDPGNSNGTTFIAIAPSTTTTTTNPSNPKRNRTRRDDDEDNEPNEDEKPPSKKPRANDPTPTTPTISRLLACPFWKHDPSKHRGCFRIKLDKISRVKQHLARKHVPGLYCEFCLAVFADHDSPGHQAHVQARSCTYRACELPGMTHQQQRELSRKSNRHASEQDQWFAIWDVIFPARSRPASAYMDPDLSEDLCHFREFATLHGPAILASGVTKMLDPAPISPGAGIQHVPPQHGGDPDDSPPGPLLLLRTNLERVIAHGLTALFEDWLASRTPSTASTYPSSSRRQSENSIVVATPALASSQNATPASSFAGQTAPRQPVPAHSLSELELNCHQAPDDSHFGVSAWPPGGDMSDPVIHDPGAAPDWFELNQLLSANAGAVNDALEGWTGIVDWNAGGADDGGMAREDVYGTIGPLDPLPRENVNPAA
ncbi:hypothetical protein B0T22DRAFT_522315 [Podospora appendiculata]|uniref:Uncharacterized protein n=1 Tax=Podospora appendiculata TaxID=314037 RepID=A0AAE1C8G2_9PEZI|nr:hypothetical protein B0T22DRAFT_522315 [Podospora appendiculata]